MTNTSFTERVLGSAWPVHMNKAIAEAMYANIKQVGLPQWSEDDQTLAKAVQKELKVKEEGLVTQDRRSETSAQGRRAHGRRVRRHRRYFMERPYCHVVVSVQHP